MCAEDEKKKEKIRKMTPLLCLKERGQARNK